MTRIVYREKEDEVYSEVADLLVDRIKAVIRVKDSCVFAVAGGRSVSGIFERLKKEKLLWEKVHVFMVDERMVPIDSDESNFKLAKEGFIDATGAAPHPFIVDNGIVSYEAELKGFGGMYDVVLLSSGEDGHVGALYPNHHSINDNAPYFIEMHDSPKPPALRMTMSRRLLSRVGFAVILFMGIAKAQAFQSFQDRKVTIGECPAKLIHSIKDSYAFTDIK